MHLHRKDKNYIQIFLRINRADVFHSDPMNNHKIYTLDTNFPIEKVYDITQYDSIQHR